MKKGVIICLLFLILAFALPVINSNSSIVGELKVTLEHPFLINNEWVSANDLVEGDELTTVDGKLVRVVSVEKVVEDTEVYNIEDDVGINNYVVGGFGLGEGLEGLVGGGFGGDGSIIGGGFGGVVVHNSNNPILNYKDNPIIATTWPERNIGSESSIKSMIKSGDKVVEVGIGGEGAPTFRELVKRLGRRIDVKAIELNTEIIPFDLRGKVIPGDILHLNNFPAARQALAEADVIRINNLAYQWFSPKERVVMLKGLKNIMKDGARLVMTHNDVSSFLPSVPVAEEGFLYVKNNGKLMLDSFLFDVKADVGKGIVAGNYYPQSSARSEGFDQMLWESVYKRPCLLEDLRTFAQKGNQWYLPSTGKSLECIKTERMLTERIRDAVVKHMRRLGYDVDMSGEILIKVKLPGPPEIIIPKGLESQ